MSLKQQERDGKRIGKIKRNWFLKTERDTFGILVILI